jgi:DNA replication and repair protein RecF
MGGPVERRKFLDIHISQQDNSYLKALQRFNKVLISRNKVLKEIKFNRSSNVELEFWTEKIIEDGLIIYKERELKLNQIRDQARVVFSKLIKSKEVLDIEFKSSFSEFSSELIDNEVLYKIYHDISSKEISAGTTLLGPHRDDFKIFVNKKEASEFCSRGQVRTITLSMKLGEANVLHNNINQSPVLALDDVLSELDQGRRDTIMEYISDYEQVLLTVPDYKLINNHHHNSYIVNDGNIIIK